MPSVTVNNVKLNYIEQGAGDEAVIFVHGMGGAVGNWRGVLERLPKGIPRLRARPARPWTVR